jgi:hypothetical protein
MAGRLRQLDAVAVEIEIGNQTHTAIIKLAHVGPGPEPGKNRQTDTQFFRGISRALFKVADYRVHQFLRVFLVNLFGLVHLPQPTFVTSNHPLYQNDCQIAAGWRQWMPCGVRTLQYLREGGT